MDKHLVLKTLDDEMRILFWSVDDFLVITVPLFLGILLSSFCIMLSGLFLKYCYTKLKKRFPHHSFKHKLYWTLPTKAFNRRGLIKNLPASHIREFLL